MFPLAPLAQRQALCIAIMSYNGKLNFGLLGDYDAMGDLYLVAQGIRDSIDELRAAAGLDEAQGPPPRAPPGGRHQPGQRLERIVGRAGHSLRSRLAPFPLFAGTRCPSGQRRSPQILYGRPYRRPSPRAENSAQVLGNSRPERTRGL